MQKDRYIISTEDEAVVYLKKADGRLRRIIDALGDIDCRIHRDPFIFIAEEIVKQVISKNVADTIVGRLNGLCPEGLTADSVSGLSVPELRGIGLSRAKSEYIISFAETVAGGELDLEALERLSDREITEKLTALKGIGSWTAKMYLLFYLRRPDVLPFEDGAFMRSFMRLYGFKNKPSEKTVIAKCKRWKPYSSYAARYLYRALDLKIEDLSAG